MSDTRSFDPTPGEPARGPASGPGRTGAGDGKSRLATSMGQFAGRVGERAARLRLPAETRRHAGRMAGSASERLQRGAQYLQRRDADAVRADLERTIRARPMLSVGLALAAGLLIGRLLRR